MVLPMLRSGFSEPYGSWKTGCMRLRRLKSSLPLSVARSLPPTTILPLVASSSFSSIFATVDLPEPDSPTSAIVVPLGIWNDTSSTAVNSPEPRILKTLVRSSTMIAGGRMPRPSSASARASAVAMRSIVSPAACEASVGIDDSAAAMLPDAWMRREARLGAAATSRCVYGCCGFFRICADGPDSTTLPLYITTSCSARSAARPRSCVMNSSVVPSSR